MSLGLLHVKPAEGVLVRKETALTTFVSAEGELVPNTSYYRRRIRWGDLVLVAR